MSPSADVYAIGLIILQLCLVEPYVTNIHDHLGRISYGRQRCSSHGLAVFKPLLLPLDATLTEDKVTETLWLGLQCAEKDPKHRPALVTVLKILEKEVCLYSGMISVPFD